MKIKEHFTEEEKERIAGALVGLAIGDALGGPVENMSGKKIAEKYPEGITDFVPYQKQNFDLAQITDDTEMAYITMTSLTQLHNFNMDDMAKRFALWGKTAKNLGPSSSRAAKALLEGEHWSKSGSSKVPSSGCLPRCAPVAFVMSRENIARCTLDCCKMTHAHPLTVAATVAQNILIERLIAGLSWEDAAAELSSPAFGIEGSEEILNAIDGKYKSAGAVDVLAEAFRFVGQSITTEEAILESINFGGDTDTRGAVAGAFAGARWGIESIPKHWIQKCPDAKEALRLCNLL